MKPVIIAAAILVLAIIGAFFISTTLGVSAVIGGVFFMLVFGFALARNPANGEEEFYEDEE